MLFSALILFIDIIYFYFSEIGTKKNVRGKTRGLNTSRTVAKGSLLSIGSSEDVLRVVGPNAPMFKNEIGIIVRDIIPITLKRFKKISKATQLEIYGRLAVSCS